jgi:hypothetical protein
MDILTEIVKEKYISQLIFNIKNEYEKIDIIREEIEKKTTSFIQGSDIDDETFYDLQILLIFEELLLKKIKLYDDDIKYNIYIKMISDLIDAFIFVRNLENKFIIYCLVIKIYNIFLQSDSYESKLSTTNQFFNTIIKKTTEFFEDIDIIDEKFEKEKRNKYYNEINKHLCIYVNNMIKYF